MEAFFLFVEKKKHAKCTPCSLSLSHKHTHICVQRKRLLWVCVEITISPATSSTYLVLLQPFLQKLFAALLEDGSAQLQRLKLVELALVQQDSEILQKWGCLAGLGRDALEPADGVRSAQDTLR